MPQGRVVEQASIAAARIDARQQDAVRKLADDRAAAMAARDAASDLSNRLVQLTSERDRLIQRQADLSAQARRIDEDGAREGKLTHDAAEALARLQAESSGIGRYHQGQRRRATCAWRVRSMTANAACAKARSNWRRQSPNRRVPRPNCALPMRRLPMRTHGPNDPQREIARLDAEQRGAGR